MPKKKTPKSKTASVKPNTDSDTGDDTGGKDSSGGKFPIVGLGASAGGLEALKTFFAALPEDSGLAYIVVVHMASNQPSMLPELLQKVAKVPVQSAQDGHPIEPNNVYIAPPDKDISIYDGKIQLLDVVKKAVAHPIDYFFQALAQEQGGNAAAVVLSGTGTDGTSGIKDIKAENGLVFAQLSDTAAYDGMPQSAIQTGLVDKILSPAEMPQDLIQYFTHPGIKTAVKTHPKAMNAEVVRKEWLDKVFAILRARVGHDFSGYKTNTLVRRISRRMGLNQIDTYDKYVRYLRENPGEVDQLFRELLIGVTHFFRDAESFDVLKTSVLPELIKDLPEDATIRVWVPGCSTGEEVYSLAIVIHECLDDIPKRINLQIFGTDIDGQAIEKAREGLYPCSVASDVSPERQQRFFTKEGNYLRIRKEIRDCAVFSVQNIIKDPPFSRLHLLCCRNLLIYLDTEAQKKLLPLFHYTMNPNGFLVLGSSETIGGFTNLFHTVDKKWKIFRRREVPDAMRPVLAFPSGTPTADLIGGVKPNVTRLPNANIGELTKEAILDQFAPTAILIDAYGEILHIQGRTGKYLEARSGPPARDILSLAREGVRIELSSAIRAAKTAGTQITRRQVGVKTNGDIQMINLHVSPQHSPQAMAGCMLVVFEDMETISDASVSDQNAPAEGRLVSSRISELEKELQITRESHQTTIEELESANEELKSTNEELQSSNEELQSTNEELESSKEELQSLNEELQTVNAELQSKVEELSATHDDMRNLLNSTEIATIFVDNDMCVRRFTLEAANIVNLIQTDIGRPIGHVSTNLSYEGMLDDLAEVLKSLIPKEIEVLTSKGQWYNMRIIPYRTTDNRIDGAVLTFTSIEDQKEAQQSLEASVLEMEQAIDLANAISDMNPDPLVTLDKDGKCILANKAASEMMNVDAEDIMGKDFSKILEGMSATIDLESKLKGAHHDAHDFKTDAFEFEAASGNKNYSIHGRIIKRSEDLPYRILLRFATES